MLSNLFFDFLYVPTPGPDFPEWYDDADDLVELIL